MSAKVLPFEHRFAKRPEKETLGFRIDPNGDLVITSKRTDGIKPRPIVIDDSEVDNLLAVLTHRRNLIKRERWYAAHPEDRPKPKVYRPKLRRCARGRDGGVHGTCRRRHSHAGQCKDAHGSFTPAACIHVGRPTCRITDASGTFLACSHCGAPLPA